MTTRRASWIVGTALSALLVSTPRAVGAAETVAWGEYRTFDGQKAELFSRKATTNVVVFFRPHQDHSVDALRAMAGCEKEFAAKPVHWVAVASESAAPEDVKGVVVQTGIRMPVVRDTGDAIYGALEIRLHPYVVVLDATGKVLAREPFRDIGYCDLVRGRIRYALREISDAELARIVDPPASETRTEEGVAKRHVNFARMLLKMGQAQEALDEVKKSLAISPTPDAYALQGQILAAQGQCAQAVPVFEAALRLDPGCAPALQGKKGCGR